MKSCRQAVDLRRLGLQGEQDGEQRQQPEAATADRWVHNRRPRSHTNKMVSKPDSRKAAERANLDGTNQHITDRDPHKIGGGFIGSELLAAMRNLFHWPLSTISLRQGESAARPPGQGSRRPSPAPAPPARSANQPRGRLIEQGAIIHHDEPPGHSLSRRQPRCWISR